MTKVNIGGVEFALPDEIARDLAEGLADFTGEDPPVYRVVEFSNVGPQKRRYTIGIPITAPVVIVETKKSSPRVITA